MKKILVTLFTIVLSNISYSQAEPPPCETRLDRTIPSPRYPMESMTKGEEGRVLITFTVDKTGMIKNVYVTKSSGYPALDKAALFAVRRKVKFNPKIKDGEPIESTFIFPFVFRLK